MEGKNYDHIYKNWPSIYNNTHVYTFNNWDEEAYQADNTTGWQEFVIPS